MHLSRSTSRVDMNRKYRYIYYTSTLSLTVHRPLPPPARVVPLSHSFLFFFKRKSLPIHPPSHDDRTSRCPPSYCPLLRSGYGASRKSRPDPSNPKRFSLYLLQTSPFPIPVQTLSSDPVQTPTYPSTPLYLEDLRILPFHPIVVLTEPDHLPSLSDR